MKTKRILIMLLAVLVIGSSSVIQFATTTPTVAYGAQATPSVSVSKKTLYADSNVDNSYVIALKNVSNDAKVTYSSSDPSVAVVYKGGTVKAVSKGKATITVKIKQNGQSYTSKVSVTVKNSYILISNKIESLTVGETYKFIPKAYGLSNCNYSWWVSDSSIATISQYGTLTANKTGKVKVTVKDNTNNKYSVCELTIKSAPEKPKFTTLQTDITNTNMTCTAFYVENNSPNTLRILSDGFILCDMDYESYSRDISILDYNELVNNERIVELEYYDIAPYEKVYLALATNSPTWYDNETVFIFDVEYMGERYSYGSSAKYGLMDLND